MFPQVAFDRTVVTVNEDERVHTLVEFTAPEAPGLERPDVDVVFVIDSSGSMEGRPLASVREAVAEVLRHLGPGDRAGVVAFDSDSRIVLPLGRHIDPAAQRTVLSIETGGSTNLSAGWLMASEMLRRDHRERVVGRIVVLTDGHVNQGIVDEDALADMVSSSRRHGVTTSCIGFSDGFQEELLGVLANAGGGNDYWCEGADTAARVFRREFDGLASVVAQNVAVTVDPTDAVAVVGVLNDFAVTTIGDALRIDLGDAFGGEQRSVVVAFHLRPQPAAGAVEVAELRLEWVSTIDGFAAHTVTVPVTITAGESGLVDNGADPRVAAEVVLLEAATDRREARRFADDGDLDAGIELAGKVVERLSTLPDQAAALAQAQQELDAMRSRTWDAQLSKQAYSSSREMSRKRMSQFRETEEHDNDPS